MQDQELSVGLIVHLFGLCGRHLNQAFVSLDCVVCIVGSSNCCLGFCVSFHYLVAIVLVWHLHRSDNWLGGLFSASAAF